MKATVHKINNNSIWCVCPQEDGDLFFGVCDLSFEYIKTHAVYLYKYHLLSSKFLNSLKENSVICGDLIRENKKLWFKPRDTEYLLEEEITKEENKINDIDEFKRNFVINHIESIIGGKNLKKNEVIPITLECYDFLLNLAKTNKAVKTFVVNGFTVDKYLIYGRLTKDKRVIFPRIKVIH